MAHLLSTKPGFGPSLSDTTGRALTTAHPPAWGYQRVEVLHPPWGRTSCNWVLWKRPLSFCSPSTCPRPAAFISFVWAVMVPLPADLHALTSTRRRSLQGLLLCRVLPRSLPTHSWVSRAPRLIFQSLTWKPFTHQTYSEYRWILYSRYYECKESDWTFPNR